MSKEKKQHEKPLSFYPLKVEDILKGLLETKPPKKVKFICIC